MQVFGRWAQAIPRPLWTLLGTGVYIAIAIPGYSHFETVLENCKPPTKKKLDISPN